MSDVFSAQQQQPQGAESQPRPAVDQASIRENLEAVRWEHGDRLKRAEAIWTSSIGHANFIGCESAERKASDIALRYATDVEALLAELEQCRQQLAAAQERLAIQGDAIDVTWERCQKAEAEVTRMSKQVQAARRFCVGRSDADGLAMSLDAAQQELATSAEGGE